MLAAIRSASRSTILCARARSPTSALEGQDYLAERVTGSRDAPPWLEQAVKTGRTTVGGKSFPTVLPTRSLSPVSTPAESIASLIGNPGARSIAEFLNPGLVAAYNVASRKNRYGGEVGYREAASDAFNRLTPQVNLARDLISPPSLEEAGLYPGGHDP